MFSVCMLLLQLASINVFYSMGQLEDIIFPKNLWLGAGNLIILWTGPIDLIFWQIKLIIILIPHIVFFTIYFSSDMTFFF